MQMTGHHEIDALLGEFASNRWIQSMRKPVEAKGECAKVSEALIDFLNAHGLYRLGGVAYRSDVGWLNDSSTLDCDSPEDHGYSDRPVPGHSSHTAVLLELESELLMIDFTAAQYGYSEFPLVQRLVEGVGWERQWNPQVRALSVRPG
jgi:hypothetical protein